MRKPTAFARRTGLLVMVLTIVLLASVTNSVVASRPGAAASSTMAWSATFETASQDQFNACCNHNNGAVVSVSQTLFRSGTYSGYYYYIGQAPGESPRGYPSHDFLSSIRRFLIEIWVYVPSTVNGQPVTLTSWLSFISVWINQDGCCAVNPVTVDSDTNREMHVRLGLLQSTKNIAYQSGHVKWSFDKWFRISLQVEINSGNTNSKITLLQDGQTIVTWTGKLPSVANGLGRVHFGLYAGGNQGTLAIFNDDISVKSL